MHVPLQAAKITLGGQSVPWAAAFGSVPLRVLGLSVLHLPGLRLPAYGVFAAVGMIAALWLSQKTAARVGLEADRLWDAGLFVVMAGFVVSRVTLIAFDPRAFLRLPLVMLALPSYTWTDAALTAVAVVIYLRWKRIPVSAALDAWAPCAAVVWASLSLGRFFTDADDGMPTRLPWGRVVPGSAGLMHWQPVGVYGALVALLLLIGLMLLLERGGRRGRVAGAALLAFGGASFLLDMVTQPESAPGAWLDPVQWLATGMIFCGGLLLIFLEEAA
ncbi:MAG: prolipoprotein diacylglyceryl transferase family protein [Acidobacteriaceae bacterium]